MNPGDLQRLLSDGGKQWTFESTKQRDEWIDANYPQRKCGDSPGFFHLPDGTTLQVFMETVTLYPAEVQP